MRVPCIAIDPDLDIGGRDDWRSEIASDYPELFELPRGLPECGKGWKYLIWRVCREIRDALDADQGDVLRIVKIKQRYGVLNIFWDGTLSAVARIAVERAIESAFVESAQKCEVCGFPGRLYTCEGWLQTGCTGHGRGKLERSKRRLDNTVRVVCGTIAGKPQILSCRQYDSKYDCFVDVSADSWALEVEEILSQCRA